jgi:hypothetical protein
LALVEIRLHKYAEALRLLKEASTKSPDSKEVSQNLGRFVSQALGKKIQPPTAIVTEAAGLWAKLAPDQPGGLARRATGWRYIPIKGEPTLPLGGADIYEDRCCSACNGRPRVPCPFCNGGSVSGDATQSGVIPAPFGNIPYSDTKMVQHRCKFCGGIGFIVCPYCSDGYDHNGR